MIRYVAVGLLGIVLTILFFMLADSIPSEQLRYWNSLNVGSAYAAIALLGLALILGPLARIHPRGFHHLIPIRREIGVISGLIMLVHFVLSVRIHSQWRPLILFFNLSPESRVIEVNYRIDGIGNWLGLIAVFVLLPILLTSNDRAVRALGAPSWKWLQSHTYTLFTLAAFHTSVFLYVAYIRGVRPAGFLLVFWLAVGSVIVLQATAFVVSVNRRRRRRAAMDPGATGGEHDIRLSHRNS